MNKGSVFLRSHVNLTLVLHHFYNTREPLFQIRDLLLKISVFFAVFPQNLYCLLLACSERLFNTFTGSLIVSHILPVPVLNNRLPSFAMWASLFASGFTAIPVNPGSSDYYDGSVTMLNFQRHLPCFLHLGFITLRHYA